MRRKMASPVPRAHSRLLKSSLGVDLVEFKKAKAFYRAHRGRLEKFFSQREVSFIRASHRPYESLAILLAAKEAVFKSSKKSWMGPFGFRDIHAFSRKNGLSILKKKDYVVAVFRS